MCDFWSAIVTKKGEVLKDISHSHETIKKKYNLSDKVDSIDKLEFYPVEILPKKNKQSWDKPTKTNWYFNIGASRGHSAEIPKWWKKSFEEKCWKEFTKDWKEQILVGKELKSLVGKEIYLIKDCEIEEIEDCKVGKMFGSSQVKEMWDSSQVKEMWDSSQVGKMFYSSQVGTMWGSSQVGKMFGSSQVGKIWDSSQVGKMWDSSQVKEMRGSSQVKEMWNSSQVGKMFGSSQVKEMWDSSQVKEMWDSSQVKEMKTKKTTIRVFGFNVKLPSVKLGVIIDFSKSKTKVFVGN